MYILGKLVSLKNAISRILSRISRAHHFRVYLQLATLHSVIEDLNKRRCLDVLEALGQSSFRYLYKLPIL